MTPGRLIAVVGPSGVGKDSVMQGVHATLPGIHMVRRTITRAPDMGGEAYDAVTPDQFHDMAATGAFAVHWAAHGLYYGIPVAVQKQTAAGTDCLANFSRKALVSGKNAFPNFIVLNITASPDTLATRLAARGRETDEAIAQRLAEADKPLPPGLHVITLSNDGALQDTVARACALLYPVSA